MKKSQFSEAKIVEILALAGQGQSIEDICRQFNISSATFTIGEIGMAAWTPRNFEKVKQ